MLAQLARPLQILHLEDDPNDAELLRRTLDLSLGACQVHVVSTREAFIAALDRGGLNLILSDYSLPTLDGLAALDIVKVKAPLVPFIIVSGTLGEEAAIECLRSGATDYVLKHRLSRLAPAVRRAMDEVEERRKRRQTELMFRSLLESAPDAMVIVNERAEIVLLNAQAEKLFGYRRDELLSRNIEVLVPSKLWSRYLDHGPEDIADRRAAPLGTGFELHGLHKDRSPFPIEVSLNPLETEEGPLVTSAIRDITERKRVEETLRESEQRFRSVVESSNDAVILADGNLCILEWNRRAEECFGYPKAEVLGRPVTILMPERYREAHRQGVDRFRSTQQSRLIGKTVEMHGLRKDGGEFPLEISFSTWQLGARTFFAAIVRDITERKQLEAQLLQAQKMEAVGRLAGGVAHDFNNLLSVMIGFGELALADLEPEVRPRNRIEQILKAAQRAASLTRQLLAFSRKQVLEPKVLDLGVLLGELDKMLRRLIGEDIELLTSQGQELWKVKADAGQVEQVIMNLVVNARDAMPHGGTLVIETANVILDAMHSKQIPDVRPGAYVMLAVSDTGVGMSLETQSRIFEPFFTTKEMGKGTGLGLATVYGIVKQSGGYLVVHSEPGHGATFKIYLPRVEEPLPLAREARASLRGTETVLVVEDETVVRAMVREGLERYGYVVLEARGVGQAEEVCRQHGGPIELLITDVILAGANGREVAQRLTRLRPTMKVLYMSGYTDAVIAQHGVLEPGMAFLQKPFTLDALARKVRETLQEQGLGVVSTVD